MPNKKKILVLGGTGFLGTELVKILPEELDPYLFSRNESNSEIKHISGSITDLESLNFAFKDIDIVVNLVGLSPIIKPKDDMSYSKVHVQGMQNIIEAVRRNNVKKIIHVSALGADKNSDLEYLKTKAEAEELLISSSLPFTILRPSIIDAPGSEIEKMLNKFSILNLMIFPKFKTKVNPIKAESVAKNIFDSIETNQNKTIELEGEKMVTIYDYFDLVAKRIGIKTFPIPAILGKVGVKLISQTGLLGFSQDLDKYIEIDNIIKAD